MNKPVTVYRIQTATPDTGHARRLGMCGNPERAERWRVSEERALNVACVVVPIEVENPLWSVPEYQRLQEDATGEPVPDYTSGGPLGSAYPRRTGES